MTAPLTLPATTVPDPAEAPGLRWGVIAPGGIARNFIGTMHAATASRLVAVCSRSLERAQVFAGDFESDAGCAHAYANVDEFLAHEGLEAVYVASPHAQHFALAKKVLEAGIPVVIEKPMTLNADQARELFALGREKGAYVQEAMWSCFMPHYDVIRQVIESGVIGEVTAVIADHCQYFPFDPEHRLYAPELGGGALLDLGVYPLAFAHWAAGSPTQVHATGTLTATGVDEMVSISGLSGRTVYAVHTGLGARSSVEAHVLGTRGKIDVDSWFFVPNAFTLTQFEAGAHGEDRSVRFTYENSLPYALPEHPDGGNYGMAFEIAEAARNIRAGERESQRWGERDTLAVLEVMDRVREIVGVRYPEEEN
ncbi:Gfo/Idh/MocA family oxidoreductase [Dermabacter vaginalis]|uniref:Gfo/Idh/MocA family protein n=1 Tax=Dermabacter vaginalis TaxID=1630135 RepID=UPI001EF7311F|nr:Gfo/Idh/MocA family oxidoreductase [Dermabacter vaginalis]MCG7443631.1 Gfo/Idh/MocA family oxidoreductase [Dermabacter vaginalis]MCT2150533.1 Gfo/Idh/MocA family oxidoreductase [Dermabacter vaginalis]